MVYFMVENYELAKIIIEKYKMKKDLDKTIFQIFKSKFGVLSVSSKNIFEANTCSTFLFSSYVPKPEDIFVNIISSKDKGISVINATTDTVCNKKVYLDMIFKHDFYETMDIDGDFYGYFSAAEYFFYKHNIFLFKIYEDDLENIFSFIEIVLKAKTVDIFEFSKKEQETLNKIYVNLKLTTSMKNNLEKLAKNYKTNENNLSCILEKFENYMSNSKSERSFYYEQLCKALLQ